MSQDQNQDYTLREHCVQIMENIAKSFEVHSIKFNFKFEEGQILDDELVMLIKRKEDTKEAKLKSIDKILLGPLVLVYCIESIFRMMDARGKELVCNWPKESPLFKSLRTNFLSKMECIQPCPSHFKITRAEKEYSAFHAAALQNTMENLIYILDKDYETTQIIGFKVIKNSMIVLPRRLVVQVVGSEGNFAEVDFEDTANFIRWQLTTTAILKQKQEEEDARRKRMKKK